MKKIKAKCDWCKKEDYLIEALVDDGDGNYKIMLCKDCYDKNK